MQREAPRPLTRRRGQRSYSNLEKFYQIFGGTKLQGKGWHSQAAEQTGLGDYMASKVDCKGVSIVGNWVGVAA